MKLVEETTTPMPDRLHPHAARDELLAADSIRERPGPQLGNAPGGGIDRSKRPDAIETHVRHRENQWKQTPRQPSFRLFTSPA